VSQPKPKLAAVKELREQPSTAAPEQARSARRIQLALGVVALVAIGVAVWQSQRVDTLSQQVGSLELELGATQEALSVYEARFGEIRASVGDLRAQLGELEALVEKPPPTP